MKKSLHDIDIITYSSYKLSVKLLKKQNNFANWATFGLGEKLFKFHFSVHNSTLHKSNRRESYIAITVLKKKKKKYTIPGDKESFVHLIYEFSPTWKVTSF